MKSFLLVTLVAIAARFAVVEGFTTSFTPRHRPSYRRTSMPNSIMFFGGPSQEMPKLYDGWFKKTQQIQKDIVSGAKSALRSSPNEANSDKINIGKGYEKEVLTAAPAGARKPKKGENVTVHCTGYGKNRDLSQKFWSTKDAGQVPFSYNIGFGNVIKGWDEGVMDMGIGEVAKLTCSPEYAYGAAGFESWGIMPNSVLCFEIEVLSIE